MMSGQNEIFDVVDDQDVVVGQATRKECHGNPRLVHRAVHVLLFNSCGDLLLQKRSLSKDIQPGKWDTSVGGHLDSGESYLDAARREMKEELGLTRLPLTYLYSSKIRNSIESENIETYLAISDQEVVFCQAEISEVSYWTFSEIDNHLGKGGFTPNFEEEWLMFLDYLRRYQTDTEKKIGFCGGDSFPDLWQELCTDTHSES